MVPLENGGTMQLCQWIPRPGKIIIENDSQDPEGQRLLIKLNVNNHNAI